MPKTNFNPPSDSWITFVFEGKWTPEGLIRMKMWRRLDYIADALLVTGLPHNENGFRLNGQILNVTVNCNPNLLIKNPVYGKKLQRYFGELTFNGFDLEIYDTPNQSDLFSVTDDTGHDLLKYYPVGRRAETRLFSKWIKPPVGMYPNITTGISEYVNLDVFCSFEWWANGDTGYKFVTGGQLQNSIEGTDYQWEHPVFDNPYLDVTTNKEFDAERIWSLKFAHQTMTGLSSTPVKPQTDLPSTENDTFYMPFHYADSGAQAPYSTLPYKDGIAQGADDLVYTDSTDKVRRSLWRRHIAAGLWLKNLFDYQFGEDNYEFTCDPSPFFFKGARLDDCVTTVSGSTDNGKNWIGAGNAGVQGNGRAVFNQNLYTAVTADLNAPVENWILLPQCLFGLYEDLIPENIPGNVKIPSKHWADVFSNSWDAIIEFCIHYGWIPSVGTVLKSDGTEKTTIAFRVMGSALTNKFTSIVPSTANLTTFIESESGIEITRRETIQNAETSELEFDDLMATHGRIENLDVAFIQPNTFPLGNPTKNPFTFPKTAAKPAKVTQGLVFGGDAKFTVDMVNGKANGALTIQETVNWYSLGMPSLKETNGGQNALLATRSENYGMLTPLICVTRDWYTTQYNRDWHNGVGGAVASINSPDPNNTNGRVFAPVVMGGYYDPTVAGTEGEPNVFFTSFREMLATWYSRFFVNQFQNKYKVTYPTVSQFTDATPGSATFGKRGIEFIDLSFTHDIFLDQCYVSSLEFDFNSMTTTEEAIKVKSLPAFGASDSGRSPSGVISDVPLPPVAPGINIGAGPGIDVDSTDPYNPVVSATAGIPYQEELIGTKDGVNDTFTMTHPAKVTSLISIRNQVELIQGISYTYALVLGVGTITFAAGSIPDSGDHPIISYTY